MLIARLFGCAASVVTVADYASVREYCDDEVAAWRPDAEAGELIPEMRATCAERLGESVGLDWEAFGFAPDELWSSDRGAYVLAGLLTVAASDAGALGDEDMPTFLAEEVDQVVGGRDVAPSEAWYAFLRRAIGRIIPVDGVDYTANYDAETRTVRIGPMFGWPSLYGASLPASAAHVLVHEAAHRVAPDHVTCEEDHGCDPTPEGAYGAGIWWVDDWMRREPGALDGLGCGDLDLEKRMSCETHILDAAGWAPCGERC